MKRSAVAVVLLVVSLAGCTRAPVYDVVIRHGTVYDGTGAPGKVEDIGIRSTRIRTLERTVVSVPNGLLAAMSLENFALRDQIRFRHTVGLAQHTSAQQLRSVLAQIRQLLEAHPRVDADSARARFIGFSGVSLDLEIMAYVLESDQLIFLAIQEELLLGIMDIIEGSGVTLALPIASTPLAGPVGT